MPGQAGGEDVAQPGSLGAGNSRKGSKGTGEAGPIWRLQQRSEYSPFNRSLSMTKSSHQSWGHTCQPVRDLYHLRPRSLGSREPPGRWVSARLEWQEGLTGGDCPCMPGCPPKPRVQGTLPFETALHAQTGGGPSKLTSGRENQRDKGWVSSGHPCHKMWAARGMGEGVVKR